MEDIGRNHGTGTYEYSTRTFKVWTKELIALNWPTATAWPSPTTNAKTAPCGHAT